jgi:SP family galactose:H+ symporter-like MFS transporter
MSDKKNNLYILAIALLVSVGGILYGYDIGVVSGALLFIQDTIPLTDAQTGLIVGAVLGGGLVGTIVAGPLGDFLGRRFLIFLSSIIFLIGITLIVLATSFFMLLLARLLLGVGVGVIAVAVPLYVAEIVPSEDRGKYMTFFQLLLTFGIVLAYFVDLLFAASGNWRGMFAVLYIPALILFLGVWVLPETPRWLIVNNKVDKARKILQRIQFDTAEKTIREINESLAEVKISWRAFFSRKFLLPSFIAISIAVFNQLTGINSFLQYAPLILKNAGISSNLVSMLGSAGIGILNFIFTIVAIALIDRIGRRPLLLTGVCGVMVAEIYLGVVNHFLLSSPMVGLLSLIGLLVFIIFFAIGPGVVVWLAISELFPTQIRGKGIAICLFFNSLASTLLAVFFLPLKNSIGMANTYWLFAFFTLGYFLVAYFLLPETKERTLEQIQHDFD